MKMVRFCLSFFFLLAPGWAMAAPDPTPDPSASVVFLRQNCDVGGVPLENCFESMDVLAGFSNSWIWTVRTPSPSQLDPLIVEIGPGEFGTFHCRGVGNGFVTLRGAGREVTTLTGGDPISVTDCDQLSFIALGTRGTQTGALWRGSGDSSWFDVQLVAEGSAVFDAGIYGWLDVTNGGECGAHYFHESEIRAVSAGSQNRQYAWGFLASCAETWFFGGEIHLDLSEFTGDFAFNGSGGVVDDFVAGVAVAGTGDFRAFGSTIHAEVGSTTPGLPNLYGARSLGGNGIFHSHGGLIEVKASDTPTAGAGVNAIGLKTEPGVFMHTPGTAFILEAHSSASKKRVDASAGGTALSPVLSPASADPPDIASQHGSDVFVETDCGSSGLCDAGGTEAHLMVYDATCATNGTWRDMTTNACRQ